MPEIDEDNSVEINPDDIRMEVYRASSAGSQKVNKTSSAVRLIHIPHRNSCLLSGGAQPVSEQGCSHEDADLEIGGD